MTAMEVQKKRKNLECVTSVAKKTKSVESEKEKAYRITSLAPVDLGLSYDLMALLALHFHVMR